MAAVGAPKLWTSTILVSNIHCASCVSHIQELLRPHRDVITDINVNVVAGQVQVIHRSTFATTRICEILDDGAFEVYGATTRTDVGQETIVSPSDKQELGKGKGRQSPSSESLKSDRRCLRLPDRKMHIHNCNACKQELEAEIMRLRDGDADAVDLEKLGDLRSVTQARQPLKSDETLVDQKAGEFLAKENIYDDAGVKRKAAFSVSGMTCASCTNAINHGLAQMDFVEEVDVSLLTNSATVIYSTPGSAEAIKEKIDDLGYDCEIDNDEILQLIDVLSDEQGTSQRTVRLKVDGMYCKHCAPNVLSTLHRTYGPKIDVDHDLSISNPFLRITYIPQPPLFTIRNLIATINSVDTRLSAALFNPPSIEARSRKMQRREANRLLLRIFLSFIVAIPTFLIGVVWMSLVSSSDPTRMFFEKSIWAGSVARRDWALFILATPVMFLAADVFHVRALKEIRSLWRPSSRIPMLQRFYRFGSMNLLVSAGTSVAYFSSVAILALDATTATTGMKRNSQNYFDAVVFLTFFILIGRWLEVYSKAKTADSVSMLGQLRPSEALLVTKDSPERHLEQASQAASESPVINGEPVDRGMVDSNNLEIGDVVLVRHGTSPPADGVVTSGTTKFNESSLTGEARPVSKVEGDKVFAGAINVGNAIHVKITEIGGSSMLDKIVSVVREGQTKRAPIERVVDIILAYFVPVITALAILTWLIWLALGEGGALDRKYLRDSQGGWAFWSLEFAIAVFVVACPCGIGLAAPTALFVGSGLAAKHGILVRGGGEAFQDASDVDAVVFDKTGTLTQGGDLKVTDHDVLVGSNEAQVAWTIIAALEETSTHPLARALHAFATSQDSPLSQNTINITEEPGLGLKGTFEINNQLYESALGSEALVMSLLPQPLQYFTSHTLSTWQTQAKSVALLALRTPSKPWHLALTFGIADPIRPSAFRTLDHLRAQNVPTYILTGDNATTASAVASTLQIPPGRIFANMLPVQKAAKITELASTLPCRTRPFWRGGASAKKKATIAFIGDGTNDAPALTAAGVSVAVSHPGGSDIAVSSASFIILSSTSGQNGGEEDHLASLITLLDLSKRVFRRVRFNFAWAVCYNGVLVPIAAGVLFRVRDEGWRLGPVWGSAAMALSSVSVVCSSLALRWEGWGRKRRTEIDEKEQVECT